MKENNLSIIKKNIDICLTLSKVSYSYCKDEARTSEEVDTLKYALKLIIEHLETINPLLVE